MCAGTSTTKTYPQIHLPPKPMRDHLFLIDPSALRQGEDARAYLRSAAHLNDLPVRRLALIVIEKCRHDRLAAARFDAVGTTRKVLNQIVAHGCRSGGDARRVCPACVRDGMPTLSAWQTVPFTYCHRHRIRLIDACPGCSKQLAWSTDLGDTCDRCSAHLSAGATAPGSAPPRGFAETIHHAVLRNLDPMKSSADCADDGIQMMDDGLPDRGRERLRWTYALAHEGRRAVATAVHGFCLKSSWREAIGPCMDTLVRRASVSAARIKRHISYPRRDFGFPTGWNVLDERVGQSMKPFMEMSHNSLSNFQDEHL